MLYESAGQIFWCLVVSFVDTGGRRWRFQTLNLEKTLCADSVATYTSFDQILPTQQECLNGPKFTN